MTADMWATNYVISTIIKFRLRAPSRWIHKNTIEFPRDTQASRHLNYNYYTAALPNSWNGLHARGAVGTEPPVPFAESYAYKSIITRTPRRGYEHARQRDRGSNREQDRLAEHLERGQASKTRERILSETRTAVADAHIRPESGNNVSLAA